MNNIAYAATESEVKEFKVSELSLLVKRKIENDFGYIRVRGEISGLKVASSGHGYFNLKDQDAVLACTCWRPVLARVNFKIEDGLEIIATGKLTTYPGQSRYQLNVEKIEAAGNGALMELLNKRKELLAREGLFDQSRKKPIPFFPKKIAIITSPTGAVLQDILHRVRDRCPTHIILWPVAVQGESCAFEVSSAINGFNRMDKDQHPDVIIVARGGGSIEDLWGFNEEIVVRATANSEIPIISAIGHETDFTLIDFASSLRAPTPTAAAELALPVLQDLRIKVSDLSVRYAGFFSNILTLFSSKLALLCKSLSSPEKLLFPKQQQIDEFSFKLQGSLPHHLKLKLISLVSIKLPQTTVLSFISAKNIQYLNLFERSTIYVNRILNSAGTYLNLQSKLLDSLSISQILRRGFAIIRTVDNRVITSAKLAKNEESILIEMQDETLKVKVE